MFSVLSLIQLSDAPRRPDRPRRPPRDGAQETPWRVPRRPRGAPRRPKRRPRRPRRAPRRPQEGPKRENTNRKIELSAPICPQEAPRGPQEGPRGPQGAPRGSQGAQKRPQEAPKRPPRGYTTTATTAADSSLLLGPEGGVGATVARASTPRRSERSKFRQRRPDPTTIRPQTTPGSQAHQSEPPGPFETAPCVSDVA